MEDPAGPVVLAESVETEAPVVALEVASDRGRGPKTSGNNKSGSTTAGRKKSSQVVNSPEKTATSPDKGSHLRDLALEANHYHERRLPMEESR